MSKTRLRISLFILFFFLALNIISCIKSEKVESEYKIENIVKIKMLGRNFIFTIQNQDNPKELTEKNIYIHREDKPDIVYLTDVETSQSMWALCRQIKYIGGLQGGRVEITKIEIHVHDKSEI